MSQANVPSQYQPTMAVKIIRYVNCAALAILGGYSFIVEITNFSDPTRVVLAIYLCLFGLLGGACELNLAIAARNFGFIMDDTGKVAFFIFVGTLGLSFGPNNTPVTKTIPFIIGAFSIFTAVVMIMDRWCSKNKSSTPQAAGGGGVEMAPAGGKYANAI
jgi:peptidoglycan/LPS O-acetylase OafA/YrhL